MHVDQVLADIRLHSLCASVAGSHGAELAVAWLIGAAASPQAADLQSARSTSLRASWTAMALYSVDLPLARPMYLQLLFQASAGQQLAQIHAVDKFHQKVMQAPGLSEFVESDDAGMI